MEHVGREQLGRYFSTLAAHLPPGGLLLNHAIAENADPERTIPWLHRYHGGFILQEIFPDSDLPPLERVLDAAQQAGFEVLDVETMRAHYARTWRSGAPPRHESRAGGGAVANGDTRLARLTPPPAVTFR